MLDDLNNDPIFVLVVKRSRELILLLHHGLHSMSNQDDQLKRPPIIDAYGLVYLLF